VIIGYARLVFLLAAGIVLALEEFFSLATHSGPSSHPGTWRFLTTSGQLLRISRELVASVSPVMSCLLLRTGRAAARVCRPFARRCSAARPPLRFPDLGFAGCSTKIVDVVGVPQRVDFFFYWQWFEILALPRAVPGQTLTGTAD
jgi:hypothetical protein